MVLEMIDMPVKVLGFAGSLRKSSFNRAALCAAQNLAPENMRLEIFELDDIPLYNGDVEASGFPGPVREFKEKIGASDALLIVTPEYNYSVPGVLKNAIDWASRPPADSPLTGKPTAIMGVSTGSFGTVRAQLHLRQICFSMDMLALTSPEVYIRKAREKFDPDGNLVDDTTKLHIRSLLQALVEWMTRLKA